MHVPDRAAMACFSTDSQPRPWIAPERMRAGELEDTRWCRAWASRDVMLKHNGTACDGCARLPDELREPAP